MLGAVGVSAAARSAWCGPQKEFGVERAIDDAAGRFGLPPAWIRAVVRAESDGHLDAVSPKGAMGLMQLMPGTWRQMRAELGLGDDPFAPRDNLLAGAAYLRRLYDAYGSRGFLAAYNAGPGRYERHLSGEGELPAETVRYVVRVSSEISGLGQARAPAAWGWRGASLFPEPTANGARGLAVSRGASLFVDRETAVRP